MMLDQQTNTGIDLDQPKDTSTDVANSEMLIEGPIPREPELPVGFDRALEDFDKLFFSNEDDYPRDQIQVLFIFGIRAGLENLVARLNEISRETKIQTVVISGGIVGDYEVTEADEIHAELKDLPGFANTEFILEREAKNTKDNVRLGIEKLGYEPEEITFAFKPYVCTRAKATLRNSLSNTNITQISYNIAFNKEFGFLSKEDWKNTDAGKRRLFGEFLRLIKYSRNGDILLSGREKELINSIQHKIYTE